jgi:hypothetical protein
MALKAQFRGHLLVHRERLGRRDRADQAARDALAVVAQRPAVSVAAQVMSASFRASRSLSVRRRRCVAVALDSSHHHRPSCVGSRVSRGKVAGDLGRPCEYIELKLLRGGSR